LQGCFDVETGSHRFGLLGHETFFTGRDQIAAVVVADLDPSGSCFGSQ
jgi:hypothetical protein